MKERLVGATVLVAAAIVFVPMILSGPEAPGGKDMARSAASDQASKPADRFSSPIVPVDSARDDRAVSGTSPSAPAQAFTPPASPPEKTAGARSEAPRRSPAPVGGNRTAPQPSGAKAASVPKPKVVPPASRSGWVVQLGSFSNRRNAEGLRSRLSKKGYHSFVDSVDRDGVQVTRVFVGPQPSKEKATAELDGLFKETGLKGIVVRHGS